MGLASCFTTLVGVNGLTIEEQIAVIREWCVEKSVKFEGELNAETPCLKMRADANVEISINQLMFALEYCRGGGDGLVITETDLAT